MKPFEYLAVLVSIILGLGVTQIITGVAHFIHTGNKVKVYWPHLLMIIIVFLFHLQEWWVFYEYNDIQSWRMSTFLFVLLYPISLFVQARLLFPFDNFEEETDLKHFYYENYRYYFLLIAIQAVLSMIDNMWLRGLQIQDQIVQIVLICITLGISIGKIKNEWVHKVLMILLMISVVIIFVVSDEVMKIEEPTSSLLPYGKPVQAKSLIFSS
jgi:hypothetical protein